MHHFNTTDGLWLSSPNQSQQNTVFPELETFEYIMIGFVATISICGCILVLCCWKYDAIRDCLERVERPKRTEFNKIASNQVPCDQIHENNGRTNTLNPRPMDTAERDRDENTKTVSEHKSAAELNPSLSPWTRSRSTVISREQLPSSWHEYRHQKGLQLSFDESGRRIKYTQSITALDTAAKSNEQSDHNILSALPSSASMSVLEGNVHFPTTKRRRPRPKRKSKRRRKPKYRKMNAKGKEGSDTIYKMRRSGSADEDGADGVGGEYTDSSTPSYDGDSSDFSAVTHSAADTPATQITPAHSPGTVSRTASSATASSSSSEEAGDGEEDTHTTNVDDMVVNMVMLIQKQPLQQKHITAQHGDSASAHSDRGSDGTHSTYRAENDGSSGHEL